MGGLSGLGGLNPFSGTDVLGIDLSDPFGTKAAAGESRKYNKLAFEAEQKRYEEAKAFGSEMWDWQKQNVQPYAEAGLAGLGKYQTELDQGFDFQADPGYQFRLSEGQRGIEFGAASRGRSVSSATLRNLAKYNSGMASQEYGQAYGRYQDRLNRLGQLANMGFQATTNLGNIGQNYTNTTMGMMTGIGKSESQMYQNIGAINAQAATAPFQNLMSIGQVVGGVMSGYGAMQYGAQPPQPLTGMARMQG